jgi:hypothetical protein
MDRGIIERGQEVRLEERREIESARVEDGLSQTKIRSESSRAKHLSKQRLHLRFDSAVEESCPDSDILVVQVRVQVANRERDEAPGDGR